MEIVAIVGRPNVGKSSLFNRLTGGREAITSEIAGVTRDRHYGKAEWFGTEFFLVDTGGFLPTHGPASTQDAMQAAINEQVQYAIDEASVILFLVDSVDGLNPIDWDIFQFLKKTSKPVLLAVNKVDNPGNPSTGAEFHAMGFDPLFLVSAKHGTGVGDLMEHATGHLAPTTESGPDSHLRICFFGRPNVGKSSLFNRLLGEKRSIVHHEPGTTRDSILHPIEIKGETIDLIDTAGVRRVARRSSAIEAYSVIRALSHLRQSDIALFTLDAGTGVTAQDQGLAERILEQHCGVIILLNKCDLLAGDEAAMKTAHQKLKEQLHFLDHAPILSVSALKNARARQILETVLLVKAAGEKRVDPASLKDLLRESMVLNPPSAKQMHKGKIHALWQKPVRGAQFILQVTRKEGLYFSYERYLVNQIRQRFPFTGWPIRLKIEEKKRGVKKP